MSIGVKEKKIIKNLAFQSNDEICGLIIKNNVYPCKNASKNPNHHFLISPLDYLKNSNKGKIDFVYHSHLENADFSEFDKSNLFNLKLKGLMYCKNKDSFHYFFPQSYNNQYVGRFFEIGVSDCLTLITNYYKNELNIILPKITRNKDWYKQNQNLVNEKIPPFLTKIDFNKARKNDIIVFDMLGNGMPCHFGIYLENDLLLHHPRNKLSTIDLMTEKQKRKIAFALTTETKI